MDLRLAVRSRPPQNQPLAVPGEVPVPVKLAVAVVVLPLLLLAGLAYDVAWAIRHRHDGE